jgi:flavodoxin
LTAIYYFSGTGNSYAVARDISETLDGEMIPIAKLEASDDIRVSENILGLVFPDYHSSLPNIVRRFVNKLEDIQETYVFGVCTYGGAGPGLTMMCLKEANESREGELAAGFAVRMPYNYIIPSFNFGNPIIRVN